METASFSPEPPLPPPAQYFPFRNGRYTVSPSLHRFGADFGNGPADNCLFQFDNEFSRFRRNKLLCRSERFGKYVCEANFPPSVREAVTELLLARLTAEHPNLFSSAVNTDRSSHLQCRLTGESLHLDSQQRLTSVSGTDGVAPTYADAIDALACQVPEDIAVVCRDGDTGEDWLASLHLCAPSHWVAEEKIGQSWSQTHAPVPGMEKTRNAARSIVGVMIEREPTVRFTWGVEFNDQLNHHPEPPPNTDSVLWNRRRLNHGDEEPFFLRVERQVIWGLPAVNAALFTIRVSHIPGSAILANRTHRKNLHSALLSMSAESRQYKGLSGNREELLSGLSSHGPAEYP